MTRQRRLSIMGLVAAVATSVALVGTSASAYAADPSPGIDRYVALGDSYSAGPFIPNMANLDCVRSTNNYPATLAVKLGIYYAPGGFTDVSCSAATTEHTTTSQATPVFGTRYPPQFDALKPDTDLVTFTLGGNDGGLFGTLTGDCPAYRAQDPTGNPCQDHFTVDGVDTIADLVPQTGRNVAAVIQGVHERSPEARVVVVGYLRLAPPSGTCPDTLPFADGDVRWMDSVERRLNSAIEEAARDNGALFVDSYAASLGHDACAGGDAWVQGSYNDIFAGLQYHPLRAGMDAVANLIHAKVNGTDLARGRTIIASSSESSSLTPAKAVDNNPYSRWASYRWADGEWIRVDLGSVRPFRRLELNWEAAYAKGYRVEVSNDGATWQTVWSTATGDGGHDRVEFSTVSARYVRVVGVKRATYYGISLWDLEIYNTRGI